jgi:energy-converting hydrogenase A subunit R
MVKIFFDLEGPISPQDNAYEVLGLARNGERIFEVISKYDDILTLEGRENYEPGDTLKLIVPFLIKNKISECDIREVSKNAGIVPGVRDVITKLKTLGWDVYIISTSYEQHAYNIARQVGVESERVACTRMPLDDYHMEFSDDDLKVLSDAEDKILNELYPGSDEEKVKRELDKFFFGTLQEGKIGSIFNEVKVCGGGRKVDAMMAFAKSDDLSGAVAVGDSITDFKMLAKIKEKGGLAVAFNGNEYSIPYADVAVATVDQRFLLPILSTFAEGGRNQAIDLAKRLENASFDEVLKSMPSDTVSTLQKDIKPPQYHYIDSDTDEIIKIHKEYRTLVRGAAGKLG